MTEIWKPIEGWPHEVSSLGRVRTIAGRVLKTRPNHANYPIVNLWANGGQSTFIVSRLVCRAFHGEPPAPDFHADHEDDNPLNAREDNLRWLSPIDNRARRKFAKGSRHGNSKLTEADIPTIRGAATSELRALAIRLGVGVDTLRAVRSKANWGWVPDDDAWSMA